MNSSFFPSALIVLVGLTAVAPASGAEPIGGGQPFTVDMSSADDMVTSAPAEQFQIRLSPFTGTAVVRDGRLAAIAGMADIEVVDQKIIARNTSTVSGNSVNGHSVTGDISVSGGSFDNFNGLAVLNTNTGNNVSINSSLNVNVSIQP